MQQCYACHAPLALPGKPGRRDTCPTCGADLRCCLNCRVYSPTASQQRPLPTAEYVRDKRAANFCDDFAFRDIEAQTRETERDRVQRRIDDLFKNL